jgi:hypothetical protein
MFETTERDTGPDGQALLHRLGDSGGYLIESGKEWCLYSKKNSFARPMDRIAPAVVKALRAKGYLVERAGGGLQPLARQQAASGRLSDHRPVRAADASEAAVCSPRFNDAESPLSWLRSRKDRAGRPLISAEQFLAGERLRGDYERSRMERSITSSWDFSAPAGRGGGNGAAHLSDSALTARQNVHHALEAVGLELASILVQVCCLAAGIEQAERILDLPQRSGKAVLGLALTALARHYGFIALSSRSRSRFGHWALAGYRPDFPAAAEET